ncbi:basic amino acid/polyamine antiporter [Enterococcus hulanensis]|uniref:Basic amino acid/polyamine antiporter n=1 Tax=Enterococcus hulanensis TaxID=2559929 RepID=A0ABU3F5Z1_9ENTE|nr:basic amino acid/polyamine antiporter [Enterococcus hulanensis]MDT2602554.1 basic amino acid/polyamine antiporter [Enterococcus hulanensis]MDT2611974.1 basic amino acid/polyamine antiporter [Enterococcus hulanensis]MDT2619123.1 basic amino acid/polyamine antiporter [Enterococcus hulanensis]MDT2630734.1 basic amino acid/polyamine antiporter [Enterococcus hulanensis]MDT2658165.1 basic amino acid/polyamine antiporter [Enterococcus hulanensis]
MEQNQVPDNHTKEMSLLGLSMIVIGSMLGGGVFNLPSSISQSAGVVASLLAWLITGVGVFFIAKVFQTLSKEEPGIIGGIYYYAKDGFGDYVGFNSAWGYWLSNIIGNVSFVILFLDALSKFIPSIGGSGGQIGLFLGTFMIWGVIFLVARGIRTASLLNTIATSAKVVPILLAIFLLFIHFKYRTFSMDVFAKNMMLNGKQLGSVPTQIRHAMLQTMWVFVGIEGAVVLSGRAKRARDVGRATLIGYSTTLAIYVLIVMLSFGSLPQEQLANLPSPSLSGVLRASTGAWAGSMINIGVIISVLGAWISWTILAAEISFDAAQDKMFPAFLGKANKQNAPVNALILNGVIMQIVFLISRWAMDAFQAVTDTATTMVLVPYVLSATFLWQIAKGKKHKGQQFLAIGGIVYGIYMLYSSGILNLLYCIGIYALGFVFWLWNSHTYHRPVFATKRDKILFAIVTSLGVLSLIVFLIQLG